LISNNYILIILVLILLGIGTTVVSTIVTAVVTCAIIKCTERHPSVLYMEINDNVLLIPSKIPSKPILKNSEMEEQNYLKTKFDEFGKPLTIHTLNDINKKWNHCYKHVSQDNNSQKYETWPVKTNLPTMSHKKVTMCNTVRVFLIPPYEEFADKEKIWWSKKEIRNLTNENIMELAKEKIQENQLRESKHHFNEVLNQLLLTIWRVPCYVTDINTP
jgi:hypothetical protein